MKNKIISSSLLVIGFVLGASALSVLADWSAPGSGCTPPSCNPSAPLNVSATSQDKEGPLRINIDTTNPIAEIGLTVFGKLKLVDGAQGDGKVLTSSIDGTATWKPAPGTDSSSFCNTVNTGSTVNVQALSLIKNGKNICADVEGCTVRMIDVKNDGTLLINHGPYMVSQISSNKWINSAEATSGTNGDSSAVSVSAINGVILYDDITPASSQPFGVVSSITETSASSFAVSRYLNNGYSSTVSVCDF